jgi:hypothetical protein
MDTWTKRPWRYHHPDPHWHQVVADLPDGHPGDGYVVIAEAVDVPAAVETHAEAEMHLIAASPELLAACQAAYVVLPITKDNYPIQEQLKAAIAKAEGR